MLTSYGILKIAAIISTAIFASIPLWVGTKDGEGKLNTYGQFARWGPIACMLFAIVGFIADSNSSSLKSDADNKLKNNISFPLTGLTLEVEYQIEPTKNLINNFHQAYKEKYQYFIDNFDKKSLTKFSELKEFTGLDIRTDSENKIAVFIIPENVNPFSYSNEKESSGSNSNSKENKLKRLAKMADIIQNALFNSSVDLIFVNNLDYKYYNEYKNETLLKLSGKKKGNRKFFYYPKKNIYGLIVSYDLSIIDNSKGELTNMVELTKKPLVISSSSLIGSIHIQNSTGFILNYSGINAGKTIFSKAEGLLEEYKALGEEFPSAFGCELSIKNDKALF